MTDAGRARSATRIAFVRPEDGAWPDGLSEGDIRYLSALWGDGPGRLMANAAGVTGELMRVGDRVLPVMVSDGRPGKASILSPLGHHLYYPIEEIARRSRRIGRRGLRAAMSPLEAVLRAGQIDRAAFVNHWLLSGAPDPELPQEAWPDVFAALARRHPRHALVVQDVKPDLQPGLAEGLARAGAIAVPTRRVHIFDPNADLAGRRYKKIRYNRTVLRRAYGAAEPLKLPNQTLRDNPERLTELYRESYITRHSSLNPDYLTAFFDLALRCPGFFVQGWRSEDGPDNRIAVFDIQRTGAGMMYWSAFGTERMTDRSAHYHLAMAGTLVRAEAEGILLDWGAGADDFKRFRGAVPHTQLEMVYLRHLPAQQRAAWHLLARLRWLRFRQVSGGRPDA